MHALTFQTKKNVAVQRFLSKYQNNIKVMKPIFVNVLRYGDVSKLKIIEKNYHGTETPSSYRLSNDKRSVESSNIKEPGISIHGIQEHSRTQLSPTTTTKKRIRRRSRAEKDSTEFTKRLKHLLCGEEIHNMMIGETTLMKSLRNAPPLRMSPWNGSKNEKQIVGPTSCLFRYSFSKRIFECWKE